MSIRAIPPDPVHLLSDANQAGAQPPHAQPQARPPTQDHHDLLCKAPPRTRTTPRVRPPHVHRQRQRRRQHVHHPQRRERHRREDPPSSRLHHSLRARRRAGAAHRLERQSTRAESRHLRANSTTLLLDTSITHIIGKAKDRRANPRPAKARAIPKPTSSRPRRRSKTASTRRLRSERTRNSSHS